MPIPKIIHQTFKTSKLPFLTRWHIAGFKKNNPDYRYEFYDDDRIEQFLQEEYSQEVFELYKRINIGAAKADFFRYTVLYKKGGVYLDIDSSINGKLDNLIRPDDTALLSPEKNPVCFVQWAMLYESGHPFLEKTIEMMLDNIRHNKFPHDVHHMTGPTVYSLAIKECLNKNPAIPHRIYGIEYAPHLKFKYKLGKFFLYKKKSDHWKKLQLTSSVLNTEPTDNFNINDQVS